MDNREFEKITVPRFTNSAGFNASKKGSIVMKQIKSHDTKCEIMFRKKLWSLGLRYRKNDTMLPGKPDLALTKSRLVIFIDGDFWHGYNWEQKKVKIKANRDYWIPKIERNMQRDREVNHQLISNGWSVLRLWEHEIVKSQSDCINRVLAAIDSATSNPRLLKLDCLNKSV